LLFNFNGHPTLDFAASPTSQRSRQRCKKECRKRDERNEKESRAELSPFFRLLTSHYEPGTNYLPTFGVFVAQKVVLR
jgi:hypothetical protein